MKRSAAEIRGARYLRHLSATTLHKRHIDRKSIQAGHREVGGGVAVGLRPENGPYRAAPAGYRWQDGKLIPRFQGRKAVRA